MSTLQHNKETKLGPRKAKTPTIHHFFCTYKKCSWNIELSIYICGVYAILLNQRLMGCLHQGEIKRRSLIWHTARSLCPPFAKVGPYEMQHFLFIAVCLPCRKNCNSLATHSTTRGAWLTNHTKDTISMSNLKQYAIYNNKCFK